MLVVVGVPTLIAVAVVYCVDAAFPNLRDIEVEDNVREVVGLVFGLLLALVIASIVTKHDEADTAAATESTAAAQLARASRTFPIAEQIKLEKAIGQYVHTAVEAEWQTMKSGKPSIRTSAALEAIYGTLQSFHPAGEPAVSVYRQALVQLDEVAASRRERLELSAQTLPTLLRLLLILGAISFVVLSFPVSIDNRAKKMAITGSITAFICFAYMLTIIFDNPFSGALAIDNASFKEGDLAIYWAASEPREIRPGDLAAISARDLEGLWASPAFGPVVFREVDGEIRGALRLARGTVTARISQGVVRGTWCERPTRRPPDDLGEVEWRMTRSVGTDELIGRWRYGRKEPLRGGWDLTKVGGPELEPPDVIGIFDQPSRFCRPSSISSATFRASSSSPG